MSDNRISQVTELLKANRKQEASVLLTKLLNENRSDPDLWYLAAFVTNDTSKRIVALKHALTINPSHAKANALMNKLRPANDLDALISSAHVGVSPEVQRARSKDYTNALVICVVLYFVFWIPGLIANIIYYDEGRRMEKIAGHSLPGVGALDTLRTVMIGLVIFGIVGYCLLAFVYSRF